MFNPFMSDLEQNKIVCGFEPWARCTQALRQALCAPCSVLNQRSPVPLAMLQMAPILSFLIFSASKKKEPRYTIHLSQKSRQTNPSRFPKRAPIEREARLQGILHISQKPHVRFPEKELSPRPPPCSLLRCPIPRAPSSSSHSLRQTSPPPGSPNTPPMKRDAPFPEPFLNIFQGPQEGSPPSRFLSHSSHRQRHSTSRALSTTPRSPWQMSPLQVAQLNPHKERGPSPEPSFRNLQGPQQRSPPSRFQSPYNYLSDFPVNGHVRPLTPPPHILPDPSKLDCQQQHYCNHH